MAQNEDGTIVECPDGGQPMVWFSSNAEYEHGATRRWMKDQLLPIAQRVPQLTREQIALCGWGLMRFGVADDLPGLMPFPKLAVTGGMSHEVAKQVALAGVSRCGADWEQWYGTLRAVHCDEWRCVEYLSLGYWSSKYERIAESEWKPLEGFIPCAEPCSTPEELIRKHAELVRLWLDYAWYDRVSARL
jgi:hypothetical protein